MRGKEVCETRGNERMGSKKNKGTRITEGEGRRSRENYRK